MVILSYAFAKYKGCLTEKCKVMPIIKHYQRITKQYYIRSLHNTTLGMNGTNNQLFSLYHFVSFDHKSNLRNILLRNTMYSNTYVSLH